MARRSTDGLKEQAVGRLAAPNKMHYQVATTCVAEKEKGRQWAKVNLRSRI